MSNILSSKDFGLKIYNRFPPKYREDDLNNNLALKNYLSSLADGGFKYCIDDINGLTDLIDPDRVNAKLLPIMFQQYGLEIFNGIPEEYLRYLLPRLGEVWSRKGSLSVVEFITTSLSGIKTSTEVGYDPSGNPNIDIKLELDYNIDKYYPSSEQLKRVLYNFIPFFCDMELYYTSMFYEENSLLTITSNTSKVSELKSESIILLSEDIETFKDSIKDKAYADSKEIIIPRDTNSITNCGLCVLNTSFLTNNITSYSAIIKEDGNDSVFGEAVFGGFVLGDTTIKEYIFN